MKKILKLLTGRLSIFILLFALQIGVIVWLLMNFVVASTYYIPVLSALAFISAFIVVNQDDNPSFKISWILVILVAPLFGVPFYALFGNKRVGRQVARQMAKYQEHYEKEMRSTLPEPRVAVRSSLKATSKNLLRQADYI